MQSLIGSTALHLASGSQLSKDQKRLQVIRWLLRKGADPNIREVSGWSPLDIAAAEGFDKAVGLFLKQKGIVIFGPSNEQETSLMRAADWGHHKVARLLLPHCDAYRLNQKNKSGHTALMLAARQAHDSVVEVLLIKNEIQIDIQDDQGTTALMWAAKSWSRAYDKVDRVARKRRLEKTIDVLVKKGADVSLTDHNGKTALDYFVEGASDKQLQKLSTKRVLKLLGANKT